MRGLTKTDTNVSHPKSTSTISLKSLPASSNDPAVAAVKLPEGVEERPVPLDRGLCILKITRTGARDDHHHG